MESLCKVHGYSEETQQEVFMGTEGQRTRMGVVNGLSYAAKSIESPDERALMEAHAGRVLVHPDSLFGRVVRETADLEA